MSTKEIRVLTQLPRDVITLVALKFSHKPYKWIRFATGVVIGAEGTLSRRDDASSPIDDELLDSSLDSLNQLPAVTDLYYHVEVSNEEGEGPTRRIFPLDPDFANTRISTNTNDFRHVAFRTFRAFGAEVSQRDGDTCALTGVQSDYCDAVHLVARIKGDEYIQNLTSQRPQGANDVIILDIDDKRNGLLLNKMSHIALGRDFAILRTPNFAMETKDVIQVETQAATIKVETETEDTTKFTAHLFDVTDRLAGALGGRPPGSPIRVPAEDMASWPPDVLFDAVYASAVSAHFGGPMKDIREFLEPFQKLYYPLIGPKTKEEAEQKCLDDEQRERERKTAKENVERGKRLTERSNTAAAKMDNMDVVFFLWHISAGVSPEMLKKRREEMAAKEREASAAKVETWRESVPT